MSSSALSCIYHDGHELQVESKAELAGMLTRHNQERLLLAIQTSTSVSVAQIAESLGVEFEEAQAALDGDIDLTLTEMRLLAIASELVISYEVKPVRNYFAGMFRRVSSRNEPSVFEATSVRDMQIHMFSHFQNWQHEKALAS